MGSFTGTPFTVDLTQNCGCGSDCAGCCGITVGCCPSAIPTTLFASITNPSGLCNCGPGTVTLTYNSGTTHWDGTAAFGSCGRNVTVSVYCQKNGANPFHWFLDLSFSDSCIAPIVGQQASSEACSPTNFQFALVVVGGCCNSAGGQIRITVTE